ncbi:MAG: hypothetical protein ACKOXB_06410 [Flavobacteriales bacterium]
MENEAAVKPSPEITVAKIISYLFHPLFMPTYGLMLIFFSNQVSGFNMYATPESMNTSWMVFLITIFFTMLVPGVSAIVLKRMGKIQSLQMKNRNERMLPFGITGLSYLLSSVVMQNLMENVPQLILVVLAGAQLSILLALVISSFWKISIHMIGIGGIIGTEILMMQLFHFSWDMMLYASILVAGLVGFARLRLNAHQPSEVLVGFVVGMMTETFFLFIYPH